MEVLRFEWNEEADRIAEEADLRMGPLNRLKFAHEDRAARNKRLFPVTTDRLEKVVLAAVSAILGALIGYLIGQL